MENKKTFGAYVLQRRRYLGMTQKELAEKLYVTESAVSKWERGLSYPDITILQNLCAVLQVTEHELLTGSEDTSRKVSEKLAQKYKKTDTELSDRSICTLWNDPGRMRHWKPGFFSYPGLVFYRSCRGDDGGFPDSGTGSCSPGSQI